MIDQVIKLFVWLSGMILQEWFVRTAGVAFFAWVSVVIIRASLYGSKRDSRKKRIKILTKRFYLPFNFIWSSVFAVRFGLIGDKNWIFCAYWFLIYSFIAMGIHVIWVRGLAPYSDKRFKTNWLGNK